MRVRRFRVGEREFELRDLEFSRKGERPAASNCLETPDRFIRDEPLVSYNPAIVNCISSPSDKKHRRHRRLLQDAGQVEPVGLYRFKHVTFTLAVAGIARTVVGDTRDANKDKLEEFFAGDPTIAGVISDVTREDILFSCILGVTGDEVQRCELQLRCRGVYIARRREPPHRVK